MQNYLQVLLFVIIGVALLWFGYALFAGQLAGFRTNWQRTPRQKSRRPERGHGLPGDPQVCPVCSARLNRGELVKSQAFPSLSGGRDRLMHIHGCIFCLGEGGRERLCPVCGASLWDNEILIARMFERSRCRSHVHVLGCSRCRKAGSLLK